MKRNRWRAALVVTAFAGACALGGPSLAATSAASSAAVPRHVDEQPYAYGHETECVLGGPLVALGVLPYLQQAATAVLRGDHPEVTVPVLAMGFALGCSTGEVLAPGLWWMYRYF